MVRPTAPVMTPDGPSLQYGSAVEELESALVRSTNISRDCAGIESPTSAHYFASVLFTSLCVRGMSLALLVPHSPFAQKSIEQWDFASVAGVARSILEVRLAFFYLCVESLSKEQWEFRWNLFNLHDCMTRVHLFEELRSSDVDAFRDQAEDLRQRLKKNSHFVGLPPKQQAHLLTGSKAYSVPTEEIAVAAGMDLNLFRVLYRFYSAQLHGFPLSFYRAGDQNRGRGVHSPVEEGYTTMCVTLATALLGSASDEMEALFRPHLRNSEP